MLNLDISGVTQIGDEGIKKHFTSMEPWQAIFELVWNGLDASAPNVEVMVVDSKMHSIDSVSILDNGDGIDFENIKLNFGKFNDSQKKLDAAQHGLHGRGRLAFHKLCHEATWHTKSKNGHAKLFIKSSDIKSWTGSKIEPALQNPALEKCVTGTFVELAKFHENLPVMDTLRNYFSTEFGWFLALNPTRSISINGLNITVPIHKIYEEEFRTGGNSFNVKIIHWDIKPASEKSYTYLLNSDGVTVHKQLSSFNLKANFFSSIYIQSSWADKFVANGTDLFTSSKNTTDSDEWKKLIKFVGEFAQRIYTIFLRSFVDAEIGGFNFEVQPPVVAWCSLVAHRRIPHVAT